MTTSAPKTPARPDVPLASAPDLARVTLIARIEERLISPLRRNPLLARSLFLASVVAVLCVHIGIILYLLHRDRSDPVKPLEQKETPVEVVMEAPTPPPPPPAPKPSAKQEIEKPATSAPRAANDEKVDTEQVDKEAHAPKAPVPPKDGKPEPEKAAAAKPAPPDTPDKEQKDAGKTDEDKDAEALAKVAPEKKPDPVPPKVIKPTVKKQAAKSALQQLAGTSDLPDYKFARPTKKSPVSGGTEDARYLAIVYGLVMQHFHPVEVTLAGTGSVSVAFEIDAAGRVVGVGIEEGSGNPSFDAAAEEAVRRSSPLPPPPPGSPHGLIARIPAVGRS